MNTRYLRKYIAGALIAALIVTLSFSAVFAADTSDVQDNRTVTCPDGEHSPDSGTVTLPATCSSAGEVTYTCTVCGESWTEETAVDPNAHAWGKWRTIRQATNLTKGKNMRACSLCGCTQTRTLSKLNEKKVWQKVNGKWYYFDSKAEYVTGWHKLRKHGDTSGEVRWCYFRKNGTFCKSISRTTSRKWVKAGGRKFYFTDKMKPIGRGFRMVGTKLYYFRKDHSLVIGKFKAGGKKYTTGKDGSLSGEIYYRYRYGTLILIDISSQNLKYFRNKKQKMSVGVVTGTKGSHDTPRGKFYIQSKSRNVNLVGSTWNVHVDYWMLFRSGGYGIHDASWRRSSDFSNSRTYLSNGSHGCVNMRPSDAARLFNMVSRGTLVIIVY